MNRRGGRTARRQTKNSEKTAAEVANGCIVNPSPNGQPFDEIDLMFANNRSKFYPIYTPVNKKVNTHNLAEIPSLQSDDDSVNDQDNGSQSSETNSVKLRKHFVKRKNANSLIESRNKFRQQLNQIQTKIRPNHNGLAKNESTFDGYELKSRKVKYEPRRTRKEPGENSSPSKMSGDEFTVKIFDKMIDLSNFCKTYPNQYIPLYPVCRKWARHNYGMADSLKNRRNFPAEPMNQPIDPDGPYSDVPVDILHFPKPEPLPRDENGDPIMLCIPKRVREFKPSVRENIIEEINSKEDLNAKELLALNMKRWKQVRKEALEAIHENEKRYHHTFSVLKSMFDKANNPSDYYTEIANYKNPPYESDQNEPSQSQQPIQQPAQKEFLGPPSRQTAALLVQNSSPGKSSGNSVSSSTPMDVL